MVDEVGEERDEVEEWVRGLEWGSEVTCNYHKRVVGFIAQNMQYSNATMCTEGLDTRNVTSRKCQFLPTQQFYLH